MSSKSHNSPSDEELVRDCLAGNARAWEALIERYKGLIYAIPFKYGLSEADAEDIFQTVCTILLQKLRWIKDSSKISSWLITTTSRECWRSFRRKRVEAEGFSRETSLVRWELPEEVIESMERKQLLQEAISQLSESCQKVIDLLFFSERRLSHEEIAQRLHLSPKSISTTRARCLKKLRMILGKNGFL